MKTERIGNTRYGMAVDVDLCTGCGSCMVACAIENNTSVTPPEGGPNRGLTWMRVYRANNGKAYPDADTAYFPVMCQHCDHHTPCVMVCPQNAIDIDSENGIVSTIPQRCFGCRYCMTACPYHARYYDWWDPVWPKEMEKTLSPDVSPRMRGIVEKCNFCHGRWQRARAKAAANGEREIPPGEYVTACSECCPSGAITFGNILDEKSEVGKLVRSERAFRLMEDVGSSPKVYYLTSRQWVREMCDSLPGSGDEVTHG